MYCSLLDIMRLNDTHKLSEPINACKSTLHKVPNRYIRDCCIMDDTRVCITRLFKNKSKHLFI